MASNSKFDTQLDRMHYLIGYDNKINESKKLLNEEKFKIYEVAEMLGFESAFYFSKVFKKVEGISPTEYLNSKYL